METEVEVQHTIVLSDSELLFVASLLYQVVTQPYSCIRDAQFAGRIWHKIVPDSHKEGL